MFLERVEMTGFKSFADKTIIEFDRGMTAVVGPNGSGKSNLSEAIRWVLGEQSVKSLRGNKMEDVIFNGSQDRKPVNLAKVTMVLNNEDRYIDVDHQRLVISRQFNRKGESSFFLNNQPVRLKDITDLLLDTGLGKNSFAMISQGKVEAIFLSKPEERRGIFEEAAGVQKYQVRKLEAQRKLTRSQDHLSRVRDILHELNNQLGPLKEQRDAALIYQEKSHLLKDLEISLYTHSIQKHQQAWQKAQKKQATYQEQLDQIKGRQKSLTDKLAEQQENAEQVMQEIDQTEVTLRQGVQKLEQTKGQIQLIQEKITFADQSSKERLETRAQTKRDLEKLQEEKRKLDQASQQLEEQVSQDSHKLSQLKDNLDQYLRYQSEDLDQLQGQLIDYYRQESQVKNQVNQAQNFSETYQKRRAQYQGQIQELQNEIQNLQAECNQVEEQLNQQKQAFVEIKDQLDQDQAKLKSLLNDRSTKQEAIYQSQHQLRMLDGKLSSLKQQQSEYVGYYQGVRAVMSQRQQLQGIVGTVADLIQVSSHYQLAIDTALGSALQQIVVQDEQAARSAIQYLKANRAGRATFLPQSTVRSRSLRSDLSVLARNHAGFIGIGSDLITYDAANQSIIDSLLATTVIMVDLKSAQSLAKASGQQLKIVTLEGDIILPGGSVTGGRDQKKQSSVMARNQQLADLSRQFDNAQADYSQLKQAIDQLQEEIQILQKTSEEGQEEYQIISTQLRDLENHSQQLQSQLKQKQNQALLVDDDLKQLEKEAQSQSEGHEAANAALVAIQTKIQDLKAAIQGLQVSQSERQAKQQNLQEKYNEDKTQLAILKVQVQQHQADQNRLVKEILRLEEILIQSQNLSDLDVDQVQSLENKRVDFQQDFEQGQNEIDSLQLKLDCLKEQRQTLQDQIKDNQHKQGAIEEELQSFYQKEAKCQGQIEKYADLIDQELLYLNENYSLSFEAARDMAQPVESQAKAQETVKNLRRSIDRLGPINLAAIEDYQVLDERYQGLSQQEEDLLTAIDQLNGTIKEMDQEVAQRFKIAFDAINHQFQITFNRLFAGGKASLELTDPSDLLATGVDIIAQPPGKRKQNLALLSGGERALTAIALLFAILETKSVPFVVLDEVEAALDDANVYRYGEYIQNFTQETQFIVITHRKGTMEYADVLYGVTMEQTGISKLASVRMSDLENNDK